jgi:hypothetical protein
MGADGVYTLLWWHRAAPLQLHITASANVRHYFIRGLPTQVQRCRRASETAAHPAEPDLRNGMARLRKHTRGNDTEARHCEPAA